MKENKISAVYKEDLKKLLISIGESDEIENGQRNCIICSKVISVDNLQLIVPRAEKKYEFVCNDTECVSRYNQLKK
jgi:hypothetical protein